MASKTRKKKTAAVKVDVYQDITDRIVATLESGTVPWRKPWRSLDGSGPTRLDGGKAYRGINVLLLSIASFAKGYSSTYWGTYKQISERGGQVRKGEESTQIVFASTFTKKIEENGEEVEKRFRMMKYYSVFNVEQADWEDGKMPVKPIIEADYVEPIEAAEKIYLGMPHRPEVKHGGDRAFYSPLLDYIGMPPTESFDSTEGYYSTLFHELVHSTGHESRLGREGIEAFAGFGSESYSKEELIAEMGAAYLCAEAGIEPRIDQNAAYIASWLKVLKNDKKFVVAAASGASAAADYILDKEGEA